jgi:hypothetical protein
MQQGKLKKSFTILEGVDLSAKQAQLKEVICSFQETESPKAILFTGHTDSLAPILEGLPSIHLYEPEPAFTSEERVCAMAIGAALQCVEKKPLQFLKGSFTPRRIFQKAGKRWVALLLGSLAANLAIACLSKIQLDKHKNAMESYALDQTLSVIERYPTENPYLLQAPNVTEFLSWLSQHPLAHSEDPIRWIDVRYRLNEFPQIDAMKIPYSASVEVEFQVKNSMSARKFHDALLQDKQWIDQTKEISWESFSEGYRTSFHLKNRTPHGL